VFNRFDHTRLDEIKAYSTYRGVRKEIALPHIAPHRKGMIEITGDDWAAGEKLTVAFLTANNLPIDINEVLLGNEKTELPRPSFQGALTIEETGDRVIVRGDGFEIPFCRETGLICQARSGGNVLIEKGPFLNMDVNLNHLTGAEVRKSASKYIASDTDWKKTGFDYRLRDGLARISVKGVYGAISLDLQVVITPDGTITFDYITSGEPNGYLRESGLKFYMADAVDHLQWKRKGYWNCYPAGDFAGNEGESPFYSNGQALYGKQPTQPWHHDTHNYYYWADKGAGSSRPLTQAAKGMKENDYFYTLSAKGGHGLSAVSSDASLACRTDRLTDDRLVMYINNRWDYPEIAWGNYCKTIENTPCFGRFTLLLK
jgi:hypothetical protein